MAISNLPGVKYLPKNSKVGYLAIIVVVFGVGTLVSLLNWRNTESHDNKALVTKYVQELNQSKSIITQSLSQYSRLLDNGNSLLAVSGNNVNQDQWLTFFQSYDLANQYPGVNAVSFSQYVPDDQLSNYLSNIAAQGRPTFAITPAGNRSAYAPVTYIGYTSPTSLNAMGYDQLSNPVRRAAITQALDSGMVTMSGKVNLVAVNKNQPAFLIYKPVYSRPANTEAERQSSILGFVFIAVNSNSFFSGLFEHLLGPGIAVQIYDGNVEGANLLYETPGYASSIKQIQNPIDSLVSSSFGGRSWDIKVVISKALLQTGISQSSPMNLIVGIVISTMAAGVLWYLTYYRDRKNYWQKQKEVQAAKDDLLSLASHQLRTPATIVKQYLGILLQNYSGPITKAQRKIIKTAYDNNERQLEIANQFLNAARLGSGRITLRKEELALNDVISGVVADQQKIAAEYQQKVIFKNPKRQYKIKGDPKYLPMVFENIINNAIKYSKRRTKIVVSLRRSGNYVYVTIVDQGIGIAADDLSNIFEKFSHAKNENSDISNGTGIGLYLVQQVVNMHKGEVRVESTLHKGSKFTIALPVDTD